MPVTRSNQPHTAIRVSVGLAAMVYVVTRAVYVPLTYDEAGTYTNYVSSQFVDLFDFAVATNHFANSVLARLSHALLGDAPWVLRLPNVLAGVAYVVCSGLFVRSMPSRAVGTAAFVLLVSNPYLLEYFALSRGYGLAVSALFGAFVCLARWCELEIPAPAAQRYLSTALWLGAFAVAANFSVLPGFAGIVVIATARIVIRGSRSRTADGVLRRLPFALIGGRLFIAWIVVTLVFSSVVFSRSRTLTPAQHAPVTVQVKGLFEDERELITVLRADATGRWRPLRYSTGGVWSSDPARDVRTLRVSMPIQLDDNLASLDVVAGTRVYQRDRRQTGPWRALDSDDVRLLVFDTRLDWQGDTSYLAMACLYGAGATLGLLAFWLILANVVRALEQHRIDLSAVRPVLMAGSFAASLLAAPVYLLQREGQLFFGGARGIVPDTLGSLVAGTMYVSQEGNDHTGQGVATMAILAAATAALLVGRAVRREALPPLPTTVLAMLGAILLQVWLLHAAAGTPYPMARTATYILPLLLSLPAAFASAASHSRRVSALVPYLISALAVAGGWHAIRVANSESTRDWRPDTSAPEMARLVRRAAPARSALPGTVRVGVDWTYYPSAQYYLQRMSNTRVRFEAVVLPGDGFPLDFLYTATGSDYEDGRVLQLYPESDAALRVVGGP